MAESTSLAKEVQILLSDPVNFYQTVMEKSGKLTIVVGFSSEVCNIDLAHVWLQLAKLQLCYKVWCLHACIQLQMQGMQSCY